MEARINLLPKQSEAWECYESPDVTELGYGGAAGGGKTRLGCYLAIAMSEQHPGSRGAIGRKELKTLRLTTLATLFEVFKELGYRRDADFRYNAMDSIVSFSNGSEVLLLDTAYSPQDPEYTRFGSLELTWAWIDESNETPEKGKAILKTRVGRRNNLRGGYVKPFWLETFNPNKGHVHRDYYKPWRDGALPSYRRFIRALPGDNPHLPKAYIDQLERSDKVTRERLLRGNFDYDSNDLRVMPYDAIMDLTTNPVTTSDRDPKYLIGDIARFGGDKIVLGTFKGMVLYRLGVYTYQGLDETGRKVRAECVAEGIPYSNVLLDEDGIGGGVVDALRGVNGFVGNSSPIPQLEATSMYGKVPDNFRNLRSQCYFRLGEEVSNRRWAVKIEHFDTNIEGYTLEQAVSDMQAELDAVKRAEVTDDQKRAIAPKDEVKEALGRSPDYSDMLMMRCWFDLREAAPRDVLEARARNRTEARRNLSANTR